MAEVIARANPGSLIQVDQCGTCGGIWCDKWELFPIDGEETARLDWFDGQGLRAPEPAAKKVLYCPRCADELAVFADPICPRRSSFGAAAIATVFGSSPASSAAIKSIRKARVQRK